MIMKFERGKRLALRFPLTITGYSWGISLRIEIGTICLRSLLGTHVSPCRIHNKWYSVVVRSGRRAIRSAAALSWPRAWPQPYCLCYTLLFDLALARPYSTSDCHGRPEGIANIGLLDERNLRNARRLSSLSIHSTFDLFPTFSPARFDLRTNRPVLLVARPRSPLTLPADVCIVCAT